MFELSFTTYVDDDVDTVRHRLTPTPNDAAPADASVEVTPLTDDLSRVVVRTRWEATDEQTRRRTTLTATRYAERVFVEAAAA